MSWIELADYHIIDHKEEFLIINYCTSQITQTQAFLEIGNYLYVEPLHVIVNLMIYMNSL